MTGGKKESKKSTRSRKNLPGYHPYFVRKKDITSQKKKKQLGENTGANRSSGLDSWGKEKLKGRGRGGEGECPEKTLCKSSTISVHSHIWGS